ncbi:MAG: outer membrane beta-barrel protein [Saprospiraceae bacterium]|nr:outer membrane beta-barrel protein [Saprospiraceae bacterium]
MRRLPDRISFILLFFLSILNFRSDAQEAISVASQNKGFQIGLQTGLMGWYSESFNTNRDLGFAYGGHLNYGINYHWYLSLQLTGGKLDDAFPEYGPYPYFNADVLAGYLLGANTQQARPTVFAGINYSRNKQEIVTTGSNGEYVTAKLAGPGFTLGTGLRYYLQTKWYLALQFAGTFGNFNQYYIDAIRQEDENYTYFGYRVLLMTAYTF